MLVPAFAVRFSWMVANVSKQGSNKSKDAVDFEVAISRPFGLEGLLESASDKVQSSVCARRHKPLPSSRPALAFRCIQRLYNAAKRTIAIDTYSQRFRPRTPAMAALSAENKDENVVTIKNLNFRYDTGAPLNINGLDCVIPANAKVILVGANGAGKSTLLRILTV